MSACIELSDQNELYFFSKINNKKNNESKRKEEEIKNKD